MKSKIIIGLFLLFAVSGIFAQEAIIKEIAGTVELKRASSAAWEAAVQGQTITGGTIISTGFKSYALIGIGNSVITIRPLTRLSLTEIRASQVTETINVNLQAGRVRAEVNPPAGARSAYTLQTPSATASVRGTIFELSTYTLRVMEGSVEFKGKSGIPVTVDSGGYSYVNERNEKVAFSKESLLSFLNPDKPVAFDSFNSFTGAAQQEKGEITIVSELVFPK